MLGTLVIRTFAGPRGRRRELLWLRLASAAACLLALACGAPAAGPRQVTQEFWEALRTGDSATARSLATPATARRIEGLHPGDRIEEVLLGEVLEGESSAIVRTSLATTLGGHPMDTTFDTHLVREEGHWRVDAAATERDLTAAVIAGSVELFGEAVGQGVEEFSEALQEGAAEISRAIREALEDFEHDLH